jgi:adenylylsulfate kinase
MTPLAPSLSIRDEERRQRAGHAGAVVWITGLSGAGKTTLADALQRTLFDLGCQVFALDGDKVRNGLCADLGFLSLNVPKTFAASAKWRTCFARPARS